MIAPPRLRAPSTTIVFAITFSSRAVAFNHRRRAPPTAGGLRTNFPIADPAALA
jgi:hypothetical protein